MGERWELYTKDLCLRTMNGEDIDEVARMWNFEQGTLSAEEAQRLLSTCKVTICRFLQNQDPPARPGDLDSFSMHRPGFILPVQEGGRRRASFPDFFLSGAYEDSRRGILFKKKGRDAG